VKNFSGDRISLSKFAAVGFSFSGVVLVSYSDINIEGGGIPAGAIWSVFDAATIGQMSIRQLTFGQKVRG
jgi:drug/metabolite transporter (DMT)-like permease